MSLQKTGIVIGILERTTGTSKAGNEWIKQEFVIETEGEYPKKICFTLFNERVKVIDGIAEGEKVEVFFDVESREYNEKWYHNINAWKVETLVSSPIDGSNSEVPEELRKDQAYNVPETNQKDDDTQEEDDLPF